MEDAGLVYVWESPDGSCGPYWAMRAKRGRGGVCSRSTVASWTGPISTWVVPPRVTDLSFPSFFEAALPGYEAGVPRRGDTVQPHASRSNVRGKRCHLLAATRRGPVTTALSVRSHHPTRM